MKKEEISLKNTKTEIMEALNEALEREKKLINMKSDPVKDENEKAVAKAIENSKLNVEENIFSAELISKFKDLEKAISAEEEKLSNLYGIEKELQKVNLIINAGKDCIAEIQAEKEKKTKQINSELEALENNYELKKSELQKDYEAASKLLKIEREREQEEYQYKLSRERDIENDKWLDTKLKRETELAEKESEASRVLAEVTQKVNYIKELESKVQDTEKTLEKEYQRGRNEATEELKREYNHINELKEKDYENNLNRLNDKVESLTSELTKFNQMNTILQEKLEKAYVEVKELATKTVESAGSVKFISNSLNENK